METNLPLHLCQVMTTSLIINRLHMFLHGIALLTLINYRISSLYQTFKTKGVLLASSNIPYVLIFSSELVLAFLWLFSQAFRWRPVKRSVFPERLPEDNDKLPAIDVFICTADPDKEPTIGVMNAVISAMALDYPPDKLNVYLSDDGGSPLTLFAMKEAWKFACFWVPFCEKYGVKTRFPEAYFDGDEDYTGCLDRSGFILRKDEVKKLYEAFKDRVQKFQENQGGANTRKDHAPIIEVIKDAPVDVGREMPLLVYVSREKRPSHHHHFKAGALNVLIRVSGILSNSPYILILDCDMYCSDPSSARQAMCFHLDHEISARLAFVQFPQKFHNVSKNDIYDGELRSYFMLWNGFDGIKGPVISGTNFYIRRKALYDVPNRKEDVDLPQLQKRFGDSNEFITSTYQPNKQNPQLISSVQLEETKHLASCAYENYNQWGEEVGFRYASLVEDHFTGYMLSCNGWISVYLDPPRPAFLGSTTTNLSDLLVQNTRWSVGLGQVTFSKYTSLLYGPPRMSILQCMCYAEIQYRPYYFFPLWCLAILPQLCLVRGIPLYPAASSSIGKVFGFLFLSSSLKYLQEVLISGYCTRTWLNDQRIWMIKSVTCFFYGTLFALLEKMGTREASFLPTNKVVDEGKTKRYQMGIFDFQASNMFIVPICTLVILNAGALILGGVKMANEKNYDEMFMQVFLTIFILVVQYPVIEGMIIRKDAGRVALSATTTSAILAMVVLVIGYALF